MFSALLRELLAARESAGSDDGMEVEAYEEDDGGPDSFDCDDPIPLPEEPVSSTNQAEPSGMAAAPSLCVCQQSPEMPSAALHGDVEGPSVCPPASEGQQPAAATSSEHNCCIHRGLKNKLPGDVVRCFNRLFSTPMKMNEGLR